LNKVIIAPPGSITGSVGQSGQALYSTLTEGVGYLNNVGYCSGATCHKFPIVMTETGSMLTNPQDLSFYNDLIPYIQNTGQGVDGKHNAFAGSIWWAWNNNALDTGGLVSNDWTTILWQKVQFLQTRLARILFRFHVNRRPQLVSFLQQTTSETICPLSRVIQNVIPFEYGNGGYNYNLFRADGSRIFFGEGNWQLDTYAGVLTFYGGLPNGINEQSSNISRYSPRFRPDLSSSSVSFQIWGVRAGSRPR